MRVNIVENLNTGSNLLFDIGLPIINTGTSQPITNQFVICNNELYSVYNITDNNNSYPLQILSYDFTGRQTNILQTGNNIGNYTFTSSVTLSSTGTDIYTFLRTTNNYSGPIGEIQCYIYNTISNTLNMVSTGPIPIS
jgi:hypothetical protein